MLRKAFYSIMLTLIAGLVLFAAFASYELLSSRPKRSGEIRLSGLNSRVHVRFDRYGIPDISAKSRRDAVFALGYVTAGDRLFQMDLIRRKSSGRLAEIFGEAALENDVRQRHLLLKSTAEKIVDALPPGQRESLAAYTRGVNAYLNQAANLPPEFLVLQYEPEPWTDADSILVVLSMFQLLTWSEAEERLLSIMNECLPEPVTAFLTPDTDEYTRILTGGPDSARPIRPIPSHELAALLQQYRSLNASIQIEPADELPGSNNWAVNRKKTPDGSAILANDMHLPVSVPNIWYRATLHYAGLTISGLNLPGVPSIVAGSNGRIAWGFTNFMADVMDLVKLRIHPDDPDRYLSPSGWQTVERIPEQIRVQGKDPVNIEIRRSIWGPIWTETLLGQPVAIRWTALDPAAVDLDLMKMDDVASLDDAIAILNNAGAPPQNVLLADDSGNIAWTLMGHFPRRTENFNGSISLSWEDGTREWTDFVPPDELPRIVNPPSGFLATANSRNIGRDYPYILGHNFGYSYRTFRISEALQNMQSVTEEDLFRLQLDTKSDFYLFYQKLSSSLLTPQSLAAKPLLAQLHKEISHWDGHARVDSRGLPYLAAFRNLLIQKVFEPYLKSCATVDPDFKYRWYEMETPLRQLLSARIPETLPDTNFDSWNHFLLAVLEESTRELLDRHSLKTPKNFTWGEFREIPISHPLSRGLPWLSDFLNMPQQRFGGCAFCVRVISQKFSASERFVISPAKPEHGILHMPGGQSGHLLSAHYADQHPFWAKGLTLPFHSEYSDQELTLVP